MKENKNINPHAIYALIHDHTVYVGKTKGKIDAVYYRHCRADNPHTAEYYYPKNSQNPSIHILKDRVFDSSDADRYIAAWVCIFRKKGYRVINTEYTPADQEDLKPEMKALIRMISPFSMDKYLQETQCVKQKKKAKEKKPSGRKQRSEKVTLWVTAEEKERFVTYAKSLGFTQSETMQYLISKANLEKDNVFWPNWFDDGFTINREEMYTRKYEALEQEIFQLKTRLHSCNVEEKMESKKSTQCHEAAQKALIDYYNYFESAAVVPLDVARGRYVDHVHRLPDDIVYDYPSGSGSTLIQLQAYLYGEGVVRFVLGIDQQGNYRKFRYYPNRYFYGISPGNERFSHRRSVWYVEWRESDGAADLVAAYPMQIRAIYRDPMDENEKIYRWVDQVLADTRRYND